MIALELSTVTGGLIGFIAVLTLWFHGPSYSDRTVRGAPSILTSIGIFGTFLGIAFGLMDFDGSDIEASVPAMINGLGMAVWSSIAGILGALSIKLRDTVQSIRRGAKSGAPGITVADLHAVMTGLREEIAALRTEERTGLEALATSQRDYQSRMVEANTTALVTALESVLRDFNRQIEVQYGDHFLEFNQAVGRLLEWQQAYQSQLAEMGRSQQASIEVMTLASQSYDRMIVYSQQFNAVAGSLAELLTGLEQQTRHLEGYLAGMSALVGRAQEGMPALAEHVRQLTDQLSTSIAENNRSLTEVLTRAARDIADTVEAVSLSLKDSVAAAHDGLADRVEQLAARSGTQLELLDAAMEKELTAALQTFGYQLTALSEKFVNDYTPLTDRLRDVLSLAESLEAARSGSGK